jgi:hypothetical protein
MSLEIRSPDALPNLDQVATYTQRRPLRAISLAAGTGFMLGGGLRSRLGLALGMVIGRTLAGTVVVNAIEGLSDQNGRNRHSKHKKRAG